MPSVTKRSGTPRARARRGAAEQQVLTAVEELLAEGEPFTTLGVGRIAERAGVSRSSFYVHFPDKTALLLRLTESATDVLFSTAEQWVSDDDATLDGLRATARGVVAEYRRHGALLTAFAEVAAYEPEVAEFWRTRVSRFIDVLRERLERARDTGRLDPAVDTKVAAEFIAWGMERTVAQRVISDPEGRDDDRLAEGLARSIWVLTTAAS